MNPNELRSSVIGLFGQRATHSTQDGFTLGVLFSLSIVYPPALTVIAGALGLSGVRPGKVMESADELVRTEQIQENPEYFLVGFGIGAVPILVLGSLLGLGTIGTIPW